MTYWEKLNPSDHVWWKNVPGDSGTMVFSFDREHEFNLFKDYPYKLTKRQRDLFDKENPRWADFFSDRR